MRKFTTSCFILIFSLSLQIASHAQQIVKAGSAKSAAGGASVRYDYLFENPRFTTPVLQVRFDGEGKGEFRFQKKEQDEVVLKIDLSAELLGEIGMLFDSLNFLNGTEEYQHKKDFSHLGNMTITQARDGKERTVKFNYTDNPTMNRLTEIFRNIATQETRVFELEAIRANDPISMPAQMRLLESELKGKHIADPNRLVPLLQEIKLDEGVPLIARNDAERFLKMIKKSRER